MLVGHVTWGQNHVIIQTIFGKELSKKWILEDVTSQVTSDNFTFSEGDSDVENGEASLPTGVAPVLSRKLWSLWAKTFYFVVQVLKVRLAVIVMMSYLFLKAQISGISQVYVSRSEISLVKRAVFVIWIQCYVVQINIQIQMSFSVFWQIWLLIILKECVVPLSPLPF